MMTQAQRIEKLRKAIMSAATLVQDVNGSDEDTLDFIESDLTIALGLVEEILDTAALENPR